MLDPATRTQRRLWRGVYLASASSLVCCLVAILGLALVAAVPAWVYWLAIGSAIACGVAAAELRRIDRAETSVDAASLAGSTRRPGSWLDDLDGVDD